MDRDTKALTLMIRDLLQEYGTDLTGEYVLVACGDHEDGEFGPRLILAAGLSPDGIRATVEFALGEIDERVERRDAEVWAYDTSAESTNQ